MTDPSTTRLTLPRVLCRWDDEDLDQLVEAKQCVPHLDEGSGMDVAACDHRLSDHAQEIDASVEVEEGLELDAVLHHGQQASLVGGCELQDVDLQLGKVARMELDLPVRKRSAYRMKGTKKFNFFTNSNLQRMGPCHIRMTWLSRFHVSLRVRY